jgi:ankyrin repeat protein
MLAIDNDHNDVAKLLMDRGADPNVWDWWGRTALYIAVDRKADTSRGRGGRAREATPVAVRTSGPEPVSGMSIIEALLSKGVDVNSQLNMRRPTRGGRIGRYADYFQNTGCTPLMRAVIGADVEVARALLDKGASPDIAAMGLTPLLIATGVATVGGDAVAGASASPGGAPNLALIDALVKHGADVNAQVASTKTYSLRILRYPPSRPDGMSALHAAARSGRLDMVRYLLENGANRELVDADGKKPIDLIGTGARGAGAPAARTGRGGAREADPAAGAEIRALLQNVASNK